MVSEDSRKKGKGVRKYSIATRKKMQKRMIGNKINLGRKSSEEHRKKLRLFHKLHPLVFTKEMRSKISLSKLGKRRPELTGEKCPWWIKDRTKLKKQDRRNDYSYKDWRRQVWIRDAFKCKINNLKCDGRIEAHHILGWTQYPDLRYEVNNGITLCHFHHPRKRSEETRLSPYFQNVINNNLN